MTETGVRERLVLSSDAQRNLDRLALAAGATTDALMTSAGESAAGILLRRFAPRHVALLAGRGGNGGDALVVARVLSERGIDARVFALCERSDLAPATAAMADSFERVAPGRLVFLGHDLAPLREALGQADLVVDGLFGSGLDRPLEGAHVEAVALVSSSQRPVVALDLPSGLSSDRGNLLGPTIEADLTIAMEFLKPAHLLYPARSSCGEIEVARVAYPPDLLRGVIPLARVMEREGARRLLPRRPPDGHKGTFGRVLVVAGSEGMSGAAILSCRGALRAGAGLVVLASVGSVIATARASLPEALTLALPERRGHVAREAITALLMETERANALVLGPGLSRDAQVGEVVLALLEGSRCPIVLDADGLFYLTGRLDLLRRVAGKAVLTPHPGEMSRLVDRSAEEIDQERIEVVRSFAREHGVILLLKGRPTAIGLPDGEVYLNPTGNTGLAKGGSGDVLAGMIGGLLAGGVSPRDAALLGAYLHGLAADLLAGEGAERTILPSDIVEALPRAVAEVER
jgi:NAD(P)H-hydrate epimerase